MLHLARIAPEFVAELATRCSPDGFLRACVELAPLVPICLVVTQLAYPMGGGESYMHQTCRLLTELGVRCIWLSFRDALTGDHSSDSVVDTPFYLDVRRAGGLSRERIAEAVEQYHPDLVHTHGEANEPVIAISDEYRVTTLVGQHFWHGLVELGPSGNTNILGRIREHRMFPTFLPNVAPGLITRYVASEFVAEVYRRVGGTEPLKILHPLPDPAHYLVTGPRDPKYALCVNVSLQKGGGIFLRCVRALAQRIPFMGVVSEPGDAAFIEQLRAECAKHANCVLHGYGNVRDWYRVARLVMVPTLVDETFCRVAYEAAMNGIPVFSTHNGYLPWLLGEAGMFLSEEPSDWIAALENLFDDTARLAEIGRAQQAFVQAKFGGNADAFAELAMTMLDGATSHNIGFFSVWGDQGLGNLIHYYTKLLRQVDYRVHIFSFQPYAASDRSLTLQSEPSEWAVPGHADSVYYSFNNREQVPVGELRQFLLVNRIRTLIVPEICWAVNWQRLFDLQLPGLAIVAAPVVETVLGSEVLLHNRLTRTLFNTRQCESILRERGVTNGRYIGHAFGQALPANRIAAKRQALRARAHIRFLHVGGHNPTTRKNTPLVLKAFIAAARQRQDIALTLTSMVPVGSFFQGEIPDSVTILDRDLPRAEIFALYESHDVSIQVPSHEGLGLGFYEAMAHAVPVISLDAPPHNEPVQHGVTGWLIPACSTPMPDNADGMVTAWEFEMADLVSAIVALERSEIEKVIDSTAFTHATRFDDFSFMRRLLPAIADCVPTVV